MKKIGLFIIAALSLAACGTNASNSSALELAEELQEKTGIEYPLESELATVNGRLMDVVFWNEFDSIFEDEGKIEYVHITSVSPQSIEELLSILDFPINDDVQRIMNSTDVYSLDDSYSFEDGNKTLLIDNITKLLGENKEPIGAIADISVTYVDE